MASGYLSYEPVELGFGTSGLRGLVSDMTDLECYVNTMGFLEYLKVTGLERDTVYIAGDLRSSTPEIMEAVQAAIIDADLKSVNCGFIPTPALAYYALTQSSPCVMVTGSHIPDDRNGIKFYKSDGEILKTDEDEIKRFVSEARTRIYENVEELFLKNGALKNQRKLAGYEAFARSRYINRYTSFFGKFLEGKQVVVYQHSAVGRDMLVEILNELGAKVTPVGRSEKFIPIDTENVTVEDQEYFKYIANNKDVFAILSTDGDSDRPFVIDETGVFHRGDDLGAVVAGGLSVGFAAFPISSSDAVDQYLNDLKVEYVHTKIGSPYVISAMNEAVIAGKDVVAGWEVNGGFLTGSDITVEGHTLSKLPTRDAFFPMLFVLKMAIDQRVSVSELFNLLPERYTQAGIIDNFPSEVYADIKEKFSENNEMNQGILSTLFGYEEGYGKLVDINFVDGIRMYFDNGDIAHIRGSGNAPQLRIYSVANTQKRANDIVSSAIAENGILRKLEHYVINDS